MIQRPVLFFLFALCLAGCVTPEPELVKLAKPQVLPLQLNDHFQIRKMTQFYNESNYSPPTVNDAVMFERSYINYGAISQLQFDALRGNYSSFYWRTSQRENVTVRYEYYQSILGNHPQAMERYYPNAFGSYESTFNVIGDEYLEFGRVVAWRILLIVDRKIVAFRQSFLWK